METINYYWGKFYKCEQKGIIEFLCFYFTNFWLHTSFECMDMVYKFVILWFEFVQIYCSFVSSKEVLKFQVSWIIFYILIIISLKEAQDNLVIWKIYMTTIIILYWIYGNIFANLLHNLLFKYWHNNIKCFRSNLL